MNLKSLFCMNHDWEYYYTQEKRVGYHGSSEERKRCKKCGKDVFCSTVGKNYANQSAMSIMCDELGKIGRLDDYENHRMGSYFFCEFLSEISEIYDRSGEYAVRRYVRRTLT